MPFFTKQAVINSQSDFQMICYASLQPFFAVQRGVNLQDVKVLKFLEIKMDGISIVEAYSAVSTPLEIFSGLALDFCLQTDM